MMRCENFLSAPRIRVAPIMQIGRRVFVRTALGLLVATGYRSKHLDQCPRLTPDHCPDRPQSRSHQHWSHAIFDDESRIILYHPGRSAREFHPFPGCSNLLVFQQQNEKLKHAHDSGRDGLWPHLWRLCTNMRRWWQWSGVSLGHWSGCFQRCPAATKHGLHISTSDQSYPDPNKQTFRLTIKRKKAWCPFDVNFLKIIAHVAPG